MDWVILASFVGGLIIIIAAYLFGYTQGLRDGCDIGVRALEKMKDSVMESINRFIFKTPEGDE